MKILQSLLNSELVVLTGTMAYGPASPTSDIDIVMLSSDAKAFIESLPSDIIDIHIHENDDYNEEEGSIEIKLSKHFPVINIIRVPNTTGMFKWRYATEKMKKLDVVITDRDKRLGLFHKFQEEALLWLEEMNTKQQIKKNDGTFYFKESDFV